MKRHPFLWGCVLVFWGLPQGHATEWKFVAEPLAPFIQQAAGASGQPTGPMVEVLQAVCGRVQQVCSVEIFPWRRAYKMAERGEVEGILPFFHAVERERDFYFSDMVVESAFTVFVVDVSSLKYTQPRDLDGHTVAVYGPSGISMTVEALLKSGSTGHAEIELSNMIVLKKLAGGRYGGADAAVGVLNRDVGLFLLKTEGIQGLRTAGDLKKVRYGIGLSRRKVSDLQYRQFNDALKALIQEGKIKQILDRYAMKPAA